MRAQLGRELIFDFRVSRRTQQGEVVVIELFPRRPGGYPEGNWFWLTHPRWIRAVSRIEAAGGVRDAESLVEAEALDLAHRTYRLGRASVGGVLSQGGIGGARRGVKCLHAHLAFALAGGFSPVGVWTLGAVRSKEPALVGGLEWE